MLATQALREETLAARAVEGGKASARLATHRTLLEQLEAQPDLCAAVLARAVAAVAAWDAAGTCSRSYVLAWRQALAEPFADLKQFALRDDDWGNACRANSPFYRDLRA